MRTSALIGLAVALTCVPAFAEEGNVSRATLSALGLSGVEVLTDAQAMEVRGMASSAASSSTSLISGQLIAPDGSFVVISGAYSSSASQSRSGRRRSSASSSQDTTFATNLIITTDPRYNGSIGGAIGGFSFGRGGWLRDN